MQHCSFLPEFFPFIWLVLSLLFLLFVTVYLCFACSVTLSSSLFFCFSYFTSYLFVLFALLCGWSCRQIKASWPSFVLCLLRGDEAGNKLQTCPDGTLHHAFVYHVVIRGFESSVDMHLPPFSAFGVWDKLANLISRSVFLCLSIYYAFPSFFSPLLLCVSCLKTVLTPWVIF